MKWKVRGNHVYNENDRPLLVATYGLMKPEEKQEALQLAAAAPELLEALEELIDCVEILSVKRDNAEWLTINWRFQKAQAAINKARGQGGER